MSALRIQILLVVLVLSPSLSQVCRAQFSADATWIPRGANCVVLIGGEKIFTSELAKKEDWADVNKGSFERGTSVIPPNIDRMLVATQFDLKYLQPVWTVTVLAKSKEDFDLAKISSTVDRPLDQVGDRKAVILPNDIYLVQLEPNTLGSMVPADRQSLARWAESGGTDSRQVSPYLAEAVLYADNNSEVTIAIDLRDAISLDNARSRLLKFSAIKSVDIETIAKTISRLRGVTLGITIRDKIYGALKVDFVAGTSGTDKLDKAAIIEALENQGVMIEDMRDWEYTNSSDGLLLKGSLSESGLRQINSLVAQPVQAMFRGIGSSGSSSTEKDMSPVACTNRYLDRLEIYFRDFDEFQKQTSKQQAKPYARWFSSYADQIDMLPAANVDSKLLDYGGRAAEGFRDISQILVAADALTSSQDAAVSNPANYGYNGYGYTYGYRSGAKKNIKKANKAKNYGEAKEQVTQILNQLKSDLGQVRRELGGEVQ
jgi:hypothetical protein